MMFRRNGVTRREARVSFQSEQLETRCLLSASPVDRYVRPPVLPNGSSAKRIDLKGLPPTLGLGGSGNGSDVVAREDRTEGEPNNDPASSDFLPVAATNNTMSGTISSTSDVDYFVLTITQRSGVFLDIDARETGLSNLDSQLTIFSGINGTTQLGVNDDGDDFETFPLNDTSATPHSLDSSFYADFAAGSYIIRVSTSLSRTATTGAYVLKYRADPNYTTTVPAFSSLPGAADTLYLDFDGHSATDSWGTYTIAPFDWSGNAAEWSPGERATIENVWRVVAEDYAPFNVNVTTSFAGTITNAASHRQVIGNSDGSQVGATGSLGVSFLNSYVSGSASNNVAFTFANNFGYTLGNAGASGQIGAMAVEMGNTSSHEFGHTLGLKHYGGSVATQQLNGIMHTPDFGLSRERWKAGNTHDGEPPSVAQVDVDTISSSTNTFGYRADDHGNSLTQASATALGTVTSTGTSRAGIIGQKTDVDVFTFTTSSSGTVSLSVTMLEHVANLDAELYLYNSAGTLLASSDSSTTIFANLSQSLAAGTYYALVGSDGGEGEIGQYTLNVFGPAAPTPSATPGMPDLSPSFDAGFSATDNLTNRDNRLSTTTLQFTVSGTVSGATVTLYADGIAIGSATASSATTTVVTNGTRDLVDGNHLFTATQTEPGKSESAASAALTVAIETVAPTLDITDVSPDPRTTAVNSLTVVFSEVVQGFDYTDLSFTRESTGIAITSSNQPTTSDNITYTVPNLGTLTTQWGNYVMRVIPAVTGTIFDSAGNQLATTFTEEWRHNGSAPVIGGLTDSPDPIAAGGTLTLTATGVSDADAGQSLEVFFYRESNGLSGLQTDQDTYIGGDPASPYALGIAAPSTAGTYTYYAQVSDFFDLTSNVVSTTNTVVATSAVPGTPDLLAASDTGTSSTDNITRLDNSAMDRTLQFQVSGTVSGATVEILANGNLIASGTATGATTTLTTRGVQDLPDGNYTVSARQTEPGKSPATSSSSLTITVDTAAPTVTNVFVASTGWTSGFFSFLQTSGAGDSTSGYAVLATEQTDELPWINLNQFSIRFSENVSVASDDLIVRGVSNATYAVSNFAYNATTFTATWTLTTTGVANEKLLLELDADSAGVSDIAGSSLDGEWTNPTAPAISGDTFPSGNGTAGGDFLFRVNVLPGDVNRSGGSVTGSDVTLVRNSQNFSPGSSGYSIFKDVNGSATILGSDVTSVRNRQGIALPAGEPSVPAGLRSALVSAVIKRKPLAEELI